MISFNLPVNIVRQIRQIIWQNNKIIFVYNNNYKDYNIVRVSTEKIENNICSYRFFYNLRKDNKENILLYTAPSGYSNNILLMPDDIGINISLWKKITNIGKVNPNTNNFIDLNVCYGNTLIGIKNDYMQNIKILPKSLREFISTVKMKEIFVYNYSTQISRIFDVESKPLAVSISPDESLAVAITRRKIFFFDL